LRPSKALALTDLLAAIGEAIVRADVRVAAALHDNATPPVTDALRLVTQLGSSVALVAVSALGVATLARLGRRRDATLLAVTLVGGQAITWSLKALFQRERPSFDDPLATAAWFSYPSGHALTSIAVYGALASILASSFQSRRARASCLTGAAVLVAAIGFSRVYLGVHYLSDVVAGYCAGLACLVLAKETVGVLAARRVDRGPMRPIHWRPARVALLVPLLLLVPGCGSDEDSAGPPLPQADDPVELDATDFVARIDNPHWPMEPGMRWVFRGSGGERVEIVVTERRKQIHGIGATVVHDVESEDGEVVEDTYDWFAQDRWGNVWYLGEDTKEYENGKVISRKGSWEHGVDGAQGGIVMPARPKVGMSFRQEYYEGEAEDRAEIMSVDEQATVPFGSFEGLVMTKDTTPLEPTILERKYYAKGIGPVLAVGVSSGSREELVRFERR
jgi:membrane-associated phospholipid phosphatase